MGGLGRAAGVMLAMGVLSGGVSTGAASGPGPSAAPTTMSLLTTGQFHDDEVTARSGEVWLGLFPTGNDGYELRRTTLKVKTVFDSVLDADEGPFSGKEVAVVDARAPLFLLKTGGRLRPRAVPTAFVGDEEHPAADMYLGTQSHVRLALQGAEYRLTVHDDDAREGQPPSPGLPQRATLRLHIGAISQPLFSMTSHDEATWKLLWAGDLDGDGKLDLLLNLSTHYNVSTRRLFLSSGAKKGQMVGEVAVFETVGC